MIDTATIIEWVLIILTFGMYFTMPIIARNVYNFDKRIKVVKVLNISYLIITILLIGYIIYEFCVFDMEANFRLTRAALIFIAIVMYCYNTFVKSKLWIK